MSDGATKYEAFGPTFDIFWEKYGQGGGPFASFLPQGKSLHYQDIEAENEERAISAAKQTPETNWLKSCHHWPWLRGD
ncbi:MAG: hypothetical protein WC505_08090 [Patescibacteria group bacterium]